ncbi:GNAT family N-acetyltransferase [Jannaschia sp. Os4]|uniref:GNAT family N-acetyltransferase n=1 Tax=Jannaschia sp. Os4 TaxID=2807617 RepID=UPI00193A560A|nr:GNAT family N-acetyltransferase [Jannaschia sp. Os4]MBM2575727.1 GNAT family N-acetyltransferase [Jannaschia sp. Os4]
MIPTLHTERLILRAPEGRDHAPLAAFYASDRSRFVGGPLTAERAWRKLAEEAGHWILRGYGRWIVERDGTAVGMVGLWYPDAWPEPEIGWDLFEGHEGQGYATEAGAAARAHAYGALGWTTAISLVAHGNDGSARVAQRLGCTREADIAHEVFGPMQVWRHPAPAEVAA